MRITQQLIELPETKFEQQGMSDAKIAQDCPRHRKFGTILRKSCANLISNFATLLATRSVGNNVFLIDKQVPLYTRLMTLPSLPPLI